MAAQGTPRPWEWWAELGMGRGQGPARPQGFKAEQAEGARSPGPGRPLAQRGEGGATAEGGWRGLKTLVLDCQLQGLAGGRGVGGGHTWDLGHRLTSVPTANLDATPAVSRAYPC